jgi:hypothetical protein
MIAARLREMKKPLICAGISFLLCAAIIGFSFSQAFDRFGNVTIVPVKKTLANSHHAMPGGTHHESSVGSVSGSVRKSTGEPIRNARLAITGGNYIGPQYVFTNQGGEYSFDGVPIGHDYAVTVRANPFIFQTSTQTVTVDGRITEIDFIAESQH